MICAYGMPVELELPAPDLPQCTASDALKLVVSLAAAAEVESAWTGSDTDPETVSAEARVDGGRWTVRRGRAGDLEMTHPLCSFHLDAGATRLLCAPAQPDSLGWQRLLLDTALVTASLARGFDALHAAAVGFGARATAIVGASGAGKTALAMELVRAGGRLVADDVVALERGCAGAVRAHLAPPLANLPADAPVGDLGTVLARLGGEQWVRVTRSAPASLALANVVAVERDCDDSRIRLSDAEDPARLLLSHALHSGAEPARRTGRFALLADLAASARVLCLRAPRTATPAAIAAVMLERVNARADPLASSSWSTS